MLTYCYYFLYTFEGNTPILSIRENMTVVLVSLDYIVLYGVYDYHDACMTGCRRVLNVAEPANPGQSFLGLGSANISSIRSRAQQTKTKRDTL